MSDVRQFLSDPARMGKITAIDMRMYRNTPRGKPQWSRTARITAEVNAPKISCGAPSWATLPRGSFDANRYINWRLFWDYSGGNVSENMCQQLSFWYKALRPADPAGGDHDRRRLIYGKTAARCPTR